MSIPPTNPTRSDDRAAPFPRRGSIVVAVVLSVGIATALNIFAIAMLLDAFVSPIPGVSENAAQILLAWGGGMIGVIGSAIGFQAGRGSGRDTER